MRKILIIFIMIITIISCQERNPDLYKLDNFITNMNDISTHLLDFDQNWLESQSRFLALKNEHLNSLKDDSPSLSIIDKVLSSTLTIFKLNGQYISSALKFYKKDFRLNPRVKKAIYTQAFLKVLMQELTLFYADLIPHFIDSGKSPFDLRARLDQFHEQVQELTFNDYKASMEAVDYFNPYNTFDEIGLNLLDNQKIRFADHGLEFMSFKERLKYEQDLKAKRIKYQKQLKLKKLERAKKERINLLKKERALRLQPMSEHKHFFKGYPGINIYENISTLEFYYQVRDYLLKVYSDIDVDSFNRVLYKLFSKYHFKNMFSYSKPYLHEHLKAIHFNWIYKYLSFHKSNLTEKGFLTLLNYSQVTGVSAKKLWSYYCSRPLFGKSRVKTCAILEKYSFDLELINAFRAQDLKEYSGAKFKPTQFLPRRLR